MNAEYDHEVLTPEMLLVLGESLDEDPRWHPDMDPAEVARLLDEKIVAHGLRVPGNHEDALRLYDRTLTALRKRVKEREARRRASAASVQLGVLLDRVEAMRDDMTPEYRVVLGQIIGLEDECIRLFEEAGLDEDAEALRSIQGRSLLKRTYEALTDLLQEEERAARLAARRGRRPHEKEARSVGGSVCSHCGKKPARVNDLCKVCAKAAGTLPKGKIQ